MDVTELVPGLFIGSAVRTHYSDLKNFDRIIVCCWMPDNWPNESDERLYWHKFTDDIQPPSPRELEVAGRAVTAASMYKTHPTVVLCAEGRNRSGLVCAMTLALVEGMSGSAAIELVQAKRPGSLYNTFFCDILRAMK